MYAVIDARTFPGWTSHPTLKVYHSKVRHLLQSADLDCLTSQWRERRDSKVYFLSSYERWDKPQIENSLSKGGESAQLACYFEV